jgi:DNA-binding protein YbaB
MPNFNDMLSKAKEMQEKMREAQDLIKNIEVER